MTSAELREMTLQTAQAKGLKSCMSEEKWDILRLAMMNEMPLLPTYTAKFITDEEPCTQKVRGKLIAPEIIDAGKELEDILKKYSIPCEEENGVYTIFGWR